MIVLTNEEIEPLLNMPDCIAAIEQAFRDFGNGQAVDIPRQDAIVPNARPGAIHDLKTMSGSWPAAGIAVKKGNETIRLALNWALFRVWEQGHFTDLWLRYFPVSPF